MINANPIAVFDFETTGLDTNTNYPIEIACQIYDPFNLEPIPNAFFESLAKPPKDHLIDPKALEICKISLEEIQKAPSIEIVWKEFVDFIKKHNVEKNGWTAPIPAGHNITGFDLKIAERMNKLYGEKKDKTLLFHKIRTIDLMNILFLWFESDREVERFNLEYVCGYLGLPHQNAHRAKEDVLATGAIIMRFLKLHRRLLTSGKIKFKNSFVEKTID